MIDEYEGKWITTYTGKKFHFNNPSPDEICIEDIAHHLSLLCRFTGACDVLYSVAEHSLRVAQIVPKGLYYLALLHDAAEAYIGDISRPVKYSHKLEETEAIITEAILKKYSINVLPLGYKMVKEADNILLATEARDLGLNMVDWAILPNPLPDRIIPFTSIRIEKIFLCRLKQMEERYNGKKE